MEPYKLGAPLSRLQLVPLYASANDPVLALPIATQPPLKQDIDDGATYVAPAGWGRFWFVHADDPLVPAATADLPPVEE